MESPIKPIFLLADSQLLFWREKENLFLERVRQALDPDTSAKAAYLGASNGDQPEFFHLFEGAMAGIDIHDCRMIPAEPSQEDLEFFATADLILLAGGDVRRGWQAFEKNGLSKKIVERYSAGVLLMGVSAGAVQLGLSGWEERQDKTRLFETFRLVPYQIDVHDEPEWARLSAILGRSRDPMRGLGIPSGGGAIVHPDLVVEPVRHPLVEFAVTEGKITQALLFPPDPDNPEHEPSQEETPRTYSLPPELLEPEPGEVN